MTSSEIAERKQVFDFADTNKDGKVSQDELKNLLVKFNEPIASPNKDGQQTKDNTEKIDPEELERRKK